MKKHSGTCDNCGDTTFWKHGTKGWICLDCGERLDMMKLRN